MSSRCLRGLASCLGRGRHRSVFSFVRSLLCVSCVPPYLPLPAYYPIARVSGVVLVRLISLVIMRVCVRFHGTSYPMTDCVLYSGHLLCW